jgi:ABC-type glycerol-3-phosphate transport system substrate-binding protein|tara:strand:+ start:2285 stop:2536 length:252 start_codon:yes stop_codon:yes gene_type:complete
MSADALAKHKKARSLSSCAGTNAASAAAVEAGYATSECPTELHGWQDSVGASSDASIKDLVEPFLQKYGVDVYLAGHWHYYGT